VFGGLGRVGGGFEKKKYRVMKPTTTMKMTRYGNDTWSFAMAAVGGGKNLFPGSSFVVSREKIRTGQRTQ
jgi:hypothetical protein